MSGKSKRGFASMDPARQRDIASKGGKAAHAKGTAIDPRLMKPVVPGGRVVR